ncbi:MAG: vicR [Candidatus Berkelbacteria bacterium]|nr:vicR [Candidatus Berkelbacteria bacterium]
MKKVALIDDEPMLLDLYSKALSKEFEVVTAGDGEKGLVLIEAEKPDIALIDVRMPKMDGISLIAELKAKGLLNIPVIILTNFVRDEKIAQAIELGAKEYIVKEKVTPAEIVNRVKLILDLK